MGEEGELKIIEAPKEDTTAIAIKEENANTGLMVAFKEDYENVSDENNEYVADLVVRTFCPLPVTATKEIEYPKEVEKYNNYLTFYQQTKTDFIKVAKPLIEKILGVFSYFDQYKPKTKGMSPSLLICNSKLDMLVKSSNLPRLQAYLNTTNNKTDFKNTVWYGIVPDIEFTKEATVKLSRERFAGNKKIAKEGINTMESLTLLLNGIVDYKIQVFFSFETCEETSFTAVAMHGIDDYIDKTNVLTRKEYSEFAIPSLPNFSVIPKNKSGVELDKYMVATEEGATISQEKKDLLKLWIEGVYIGAGYVAAGTVAAYQCPEYLKKGFTNVSKLYPGVRFDIEAGNNCLKLPTSLAKEISGYTNVIKDSINNRNFGFIFSSDGGIDEGRDIKNITVYKARSMHANDDEYESIYKTLTATYVTRMMRAKTSDYKHDNVVSFFSANPQSQKMIWSSDSSHVNSIMQTGDEMGFNIQEDYNLCNVDLVFNGNTKNLEIVMSKKATSK